MRYVLALDTSTEVCATGLGRWPDDLSGIPVVLAVRDIMAPRAALGRLLPTARRLLSDMGVAVGDLDRVIVGRGPGSYTGVRIGMAAAKGLAHGAGIPLQGVSSLDAVAWRFAGGYEGLLGVVGDAMRGEVYAVLYECGPEGPRRLSEDAVLAPEESVANWSDLIGERAILLTGDGLAKHADVFSVALGERMRSVLEDEWRPGGAGLLAAAWADRHEETAHHAGEVLPVYTNLSDAEARERARGANVPRTGVAGPPLTEGES